MLSRLSFVLTAVCFLSACEMTPQMPTADSWTESNGLERYEKLKQQIEPMALLGDPRSEYDLAQAYKMSFDQDERKKAEPLLKKLVDKKNLRAIKSYVSGQLSGQFGYIDDTGLTKFAKELKASESDIHAKHQKLQAKWEKIIALDFEQFSAIYRAAQPLCEQPLTNTPKVLKKSDSYLYSLYLLECISNYSFKQNHQKRFAIIAKIYALHCKVEEKPEDECVSHGYKQLASANFSPESNPNDLKLITKALLYVLNDNSSFFDYYGKYTAFIYLRHSVKKKIIDSYDYVQNGREDYQSAINILQSVLMTPKLTSFEIAYTQYILSSIMLQQDKYSKSAIAGLEKAFAQGVLSPKVTREIELLLAHSYYNVDESAKSIAMIATILDDYEPNYIFLPPKAKQVITEQFAHLLK